jgi:hypothetical protein
MNADAQVFVHVLSAITLFGSTGAVAVLAVAARGRTEQLPLARASFWTLAVVALPALVLTIVFGSWAESVIDYPGEPGWVGIGVAVGDGGVLVLLAAAAAAYRWSRRPDTAWAPTAIGVLTGLYLVALAVGWWVMSAKVPS